MGLELKYWRSIVQNEVWKRGDQESTGRMKLVEALRVICDRRAPATVKGKGSGDVNGSHRKSRTKWSGGQKSAFPSLNCCLVTLK